MFSGCDRTSVYLELGLAIVARSRYTQDEVSQKAGMEDEGGGVLMSTQP